MRLEDRHCEWAHAGGTENIDSGGNIHCGHCFFVACTGTHTMCQVRVNAQVSRKLGGSQLQFLIADQVTALRQTNLAHKRRLDSTTALIERDLAALQR